LPVTDTRANRGAVLVTGASSGIGRSAALALEALGFQVYAGVRNERDAASLSSESSKRLRTLVLDITQDEQLSSAARVLEEDLKDVGLAGLVNNAGICTGGPLELMPLAELRRHLEVNLIGHVGVIQAMLPLLRRAKGRIVNIGSTSGRIAGRFLGPYCASKAALDAVTKTLQLELAGTGVHVCIIEPGVVATPFWSKVLATEEKLCSDFPSQGRELYEAELTRRRRKVAELGRAGSPPELVCKAIVDALTSARPALRYVVGRDAKIRIAAARLLPERLWHRLGTRNSSA
jgi:NAD(P)-dependent dehydrogenase (short-subunit alcohol dehydrogenase family)